ncbi:hypothetical protein [Tenacibaculum dicentrarchi]|uniref:hypothetical protein n=1 Tax=Tenacibaculum dicentrarchi TaxID=669041 RepID=UPI003517E0CA
MSDTITITDIVTSYGAHYIPGQGKVSELIRLQKQPTFTTGYATPIISDATIYRAPQAYMDELIQPWQGDFTAKGGVVFKPNDIPTFKIKIDSSFQPDILEESYLGFMTQIAVADRSKWPFVKWFIEVYVLEQQKEDLENQAYGKGVYKEPVKGVPGSAKDTMDGIEKLIDDGIAGTKTAHSLINAVALSTSFSRSTAFDGIEEFIENIDEKLLNKPMTLGCDPKIARWYFKDRRDTLGANANYSDKNAKRIDDYENVNWAPMPSLAGTGLIFATPTKNFVHIRPKKQMNPIKVESGKRTVDVMADWREGLGFLFNELVYAYKPTV